MPQQERKKFVKYPGGSWDWRIPGFGDALKEALGPHAALEPTWTLEDMESKVGCKITDIMKTYNDDARQHGTTVIQARMLVEDFVTKCMDAISALCYGKPWLYKVNFTGPLLACALHQFQYCRVFSRVLAPALEKYIEDGIFNWAEEERVSKAMTDALVECGVSNTKKALGHLQKSYDEAYFKSPYGTHRDPVPEIGMLKDFIKGWMQEFVNRGFGVISSVVTVKNGEVNWIAQLFQNLCSPERACLPHELTSMIKTPPAHPWDFIQSCALECWASWAPSENSGKKKKAGGEAMPVAAPPPVAAFSAQTAQASAQYAAQLQAIYGAYGAQVPGSSLAMGQPY